jgi:hypothetical protein
MIYSQRQHRALGHATVARCDADPGPLRYTRRGDVNFRHGGAGGDRYRCQTSLRWPVARRSHDYSSGWRPFRQSDCPGRSAPPSTFMGLPSMTLVPPAPSEDWLGCNRGERLRNRSQ